MLNKYIFEDKNYEKALSKALETLMIQEDEIIIKSSETEAKLFKGKKIELEIIKKDDINKYIQNFIMNLTVLMDLEVNISISNELNIYNINLNCNNNALLIGKDGRTINALQEIIRMNFKKELGDLIRLNVDAANYKNRKLKNFEYEIKKIIQEVNNTKMEVKLDPMNSYNRRIIHNLANNYDNIKTKSSGEGLERHIIIYYKED